MDKWVILAICITISLVSINVITTIFNNSNKGIDMSLDSKNIKQYPALNFLSKVANIIAWLIVVISFFSGLFYFSTGMSLDVYFIYFIAGAIVTFISFVFWRAISEILILFVDIAQDTRMMRLNKSE
tara:strand:+ start:320 stop:700 length:381 start_codon:yes stop_codon:yes gene_type:complete